MGIKTVRNSGGITEGTAAVVSASDSAPGFLENKIVAGANISLAVLGGGDYETLQITSSAGGGVSALDDLSDVTLTTPSNTQILQYNGSQWVNVNYTPSLGLNGLSDVTISSPVTGENLAYDSGTATWYNYREFPVAVARKKNVYVDNTASSGNLLTLGVGGGVSFLGDTELYNDTNKTFRSTVTLSNAAPFGYYVLNGWLEIDTSAYATSGNIDIEIEINSNFYSLWNQDVNNETKWASFSFPIYELSSQEEVIIRIYNTVNCAVDYRFAFVSVGQYVRPS